jgi:threonine dehydratase
VERPFDRAGLADALRVVREHLPPTPQIRWPRLCAATGAEVWVKHENHTPTAAFKVRGGLVLLDALRREHGTIPPIVSATRGNHGQSLAFAGRAFGAEVTIVVPIGNDPDQNAAIRGFGARLVEYGDDFAAAQEHSVELAGRSGGLLIPPYHPELVRGVATYAAELFEAAGELDAVYAPVGMGSGVSGLIAVRDLLGLPTEIYGVVARGAPAAALSFAAGRVVTTARADTIADGVATRVPDASATAVIRAGAAGVLQVGDDEIRSAMRLMFAATHNVAEGAGAVGLAGLMSRVGQHEGGRVGVILSGGNMSGPRLAEVLSE